MSTKRGKAAIEQNKINKAKYVTRRNAVFAIAIVIVVWLVLDNLL